MATDINIASHTNPESAPPVLKLREALRPFVNAYRKEADPIGDSDLDDEQPRGVFVTLGDCRKAAFVLSQEPPTAQQPEAPPVAQQPPPCPRCAGPHRREDCQAQPVAAQQPEAPQADDMVARLRGRAKWLARVPEDDGCAYVDHKHDAKLHAEAAARIESDAERIRVLTLRVETAERRLAVYNSGGFADADALAAAYATQADELAASRERIRALEAERERRNDDAPVPAPPAEPTRELVEQAVSDAVEQLRKREYITDARTLRRMVDAAHDAIETLGCYAAAPAAEPVAPRDDAAPPEPTRAY